VGKITLVTRVFPEGEKVYAVLVEYDCEIDGGKLTSETYMVEAETKEGPVARTIKRVYANNTGDLVPPSLPAGGRFVVIELDPEDAIAKTISFSSDTFLSTRVKLNYTVTQKIAISTGGGKTVAPFTAQNTDEKHLVIDDFSASVYVDEESGAEVPYRFFIPQNIGSDKKYPLVVFLHGAGERGRDNYIQLAGNKGAVVWAQPGHQAVHRCFVLAPQCSPDSSWTKLLSGGDPFEPGDELLSVSCLIKDLVSRYNIDSNRIYVTGLSMGGFGTWAMIMEHPELFAGAIPICGGGDPRKVDRIKDIPVWVFHAEDDPLVPVSLSREVVRNLVEIGGRVKYTEFLKDHLESKGWSAHSSWIPAYEDEKVINWLFKRSKA